LTKPLGCGRNILATPRVCVKKVSALVQGLFNCDPIQSGQDTLLMQVFEQSIFDPIYVPGSGMCYCPACATIVSASTSDHFLPGSDMTFGMRTKLGRGYVSQVCISMFFDVQPVDIKAINPDRPAFDTNVTFAIMTDTVSFDRNMIYKCVFSSNEVDLKGQEYSDFIIDPETDKLGTCAAPLIPDPGQDAPNTIEINVSITEYDPSCPDTDVQINSTSFPVTYKRTFKLGEVIGTVTTAAESLISISAEGLEHATGQFGSCFFLINDADDGLETKGFVYGGNLHCYPPDWDTIKDTMRSLKIQFALNDDYYSRCDPVVIPTTDNALGLGMAAQQIAVLCVIAVIGVCIDIFLFCFLQKKKAVDGYEKISAGNVDVDVKDIQMGESVGKGSYAEVFSGTWRGAIVAVKRFRIADLDEEFLEAFEREVNLMRTLRSPYIIQFLGSAFVPPDNICIVTEYMARGSLHSILHNYTIPLSWELMLSMLQDAVRGMIYLHTCQPPIYHRDLKSLNLLVDDFWVCKVSDFGLSTAAVAERQETQTACGTLSWTAPEVLQSGQFSTKADVYSFGVVLWECLCRANPFQGVQDFLIISEVPEGRRPDIPSWCPAPYEALMKRCWDGNPKARPEFSEVLEIMTAFNDKEWKEEPGYSLHDSMSYSSADEDSSSVIGTKSS